MRVIISRCDVAGGHLSDGMTGHFAAVLVLLLGATQAIKFMVEPSFEYYGGRGQCVKMRIPGNSLVTGFFKIAPQPDVKSNVVVLRYNFYICL